MCFKHINCFYSLLSLYYCISLSLFLRFYMFKNETKSLKFKALYFFTCIFSYNSENLNAIMNLKEFCQSPEGTEESFVCALINTQIRTKKDGVPYLVLNFQDKTGKVDVPIWSDYEKFQTLTLPTTVNTVIKVSSVSSNRRNFRLSNLSISSVPVEEFVRRIDPTPYRSHLREVILSLKEPYMKLVLSVLDYPPVKENFLIAPGSLSFHQNYDSGLIFHTSNVTHWAEKFYDFYKSQNIDLNRDLLLTAAILHDISKTVEYVRDGLVWLKSPDLLPHPLQAIVWLNEVNKTLNPAQFAALQELILSHHGEHGAYPLKSLESYALHFADNLDGQLHSPSHSSYGYLD